VSECERMQCESVKFKRNCRVRVCGRRLSPVLINPRFSFCKENRKREIDYEQEKSEKTEKSSVSECERMQCESVECERNCRVQVCGRRLSPVLRLTGPMSASSLCVAASTSPPYIYIYDSLSIGASGCNRLKGHIYICVCAFFLLDIFFTPLTLTYPHEARAGQVFYGEKRMSKIWPGLLELISRFWPLPSCSCSLPLPLPSHHI
jgi:hypothetical protein